jgi:hypothetical protein
MKVLNVINVIFELSNYPIGTLGWILNIIDNSELVISDRGSELPAIFLKTDNGDGTYTYRFLCKKATEDTNSSFVLTDDGYACAYPQNSHDMVGFEKNPLTPACKKAVEDLIMDAKDVFAEWWENQ